MFGYFRKWKTAYNTIRMLSELQNKNVVDDYTCGLQNGIELCLAACEERKPEFMTFTAEPKNIEVEEEIGRTVVTGIRRINS